MVKNMNVMKVICGTCAGIGKHYNWKTIYMNNVSSTMEQNYMEDVTAIAEREEIVCQACNGKGYTEYATFTLEEAKAILKHCGLSTES